jgi:hypothetical protein
MNMNDLFQSAVDTGDLTPESAAIMIQADLGNVIQQGFGVDIGDVGVSETVLVTVIVDDSSSIDACHNTQKIIDGHNMVIDALKASKQKEGILFHTTYLNEGILSPFVKIENAIRMDTINYRPYGGTPLYDRVIEALGTIIARVVKSQDDGVACRTVTLIVTDGADTESKHWAKDVASIVKDLLKMETNIVAAMGVDDGSTNFRKVFKDMGIEDKWILTPKNTQTDIRRAFAVFSQSATQASQSAASFTQAMTTGVGAFGYL